MHRKAYNFIVHVRSKEAYTSKVCCSKVKKATTLAVCDNLIIVSYMHAWWMITSTSD